MAIPVVKLVYYMNMVSWCNKKVLRLGLLQYQFNYHNLNCGARLVSEQCANNSHQNDTKTVRTRIGSNVQSKPTVDSNLATKNYQMLYKFPYIRVGAIVNRLKKYFSISTAASVPPCLLLKTLDIISSDTTIIFCVVGGMTCLMLHTAGIMFYKLLGALYLSTDNSTVKISYLDFWGKRKDIFCPITDVIPLSEINERLTDPYINFQRYSTKKKLHFSLRYGIIVDKVLFTEVFGKTD